MAILNPQVVKEAAKRMFPLQLRDKVNYLVSDCPVHNVEYKLEEISSIIAAGKRLGVTSAEVFTEEEIRQLTVELAHLKVLKMGKEARDFLVENLREKGVDPAIFEQEQ